MRFLAFANFDTASEWSEPVSSAQQAGARGRCLDDTVVCNQRDVLFGF
jgi:hypothetical protein